MPNHHHHGPTPAETDDHPTYDRAWWEQRYAEHESVWSGQPNPQLVAEVAGLTPGRALDVGSGEGADSLWLAGRGWTVTALDFSRAALDKGAAHAAAAGPDLTARITWLEQDLLDWEPEPAAYDLVSSQFMHLPPDDLARVFARLATAVAPGGTLLIVGHHVSDIDTGLRPDRPEMFFTAARVGGSLGPDWDVLVAEERPRTVTTPDGEQVPIQDTVLRAVRR